MEKQCSLPDKHVSNIGVCYVIRYIATLFPIKSDKTRFFYIKNGWTSPLMEEPTAWTGNNAALHITFWKQKFQLTKREIIDKNDHDCRQSVHLMPYTTFQLIGSELLAQFVHIESKSLWYSKTWTVDQISITWRQLVAFGRKIFNYDWDGFILLLSW